MLATFSPSTADAPTSLMAVANDCKVDGFDWQQIVTNLPVPFEDADSKPLTAPFYDPPAAGYTYMLQKPVDYVSFLPPDQTFPFYYNPTIVSIGCAIGLGEGVCSLPITSSDGQTLNFFDSPWNVGLPAGRYIGFTTRLVGVQAGKAVGKTFFEWIWISTYTGPPPDGGNTGGVQIVQTASSLPVDGSGTGGVKIISINGVPHTGDVNGDGVVNCADLDIVKAAFGEKVGQTGFDMRADVNDDGIVNILDLSYVAKQLPAGTLCQ
jgi:Dockerin type I domain